MSGYFSLSFLYTNFKSHPIKWCIQLVYKSIAFGVYESFESISPIDCIIKSSVSPSKILFSLTIIFENLSIAFISAAVKTTPRRQLCAHTNTSCASGINIPV